MAVTPEFERLLSRYEWIEIDHCPGRYRLAKPLWDLPPLALAGESYTQHVFRQDSTADTVLLVRFESGGLLSYRRANGRYIHTLNTEAGLGRILARLGIADPGCCVTHTGAD